MNSLIKVYFFPMDSIPYSMELKSNGHFVNTFGTGFFDEAGKSYMDLTKIANGLL